MEAVLEQFVTHVCHMRPSSHNQVHVKRVVANTWAILDGYLKIVLILGAVIMLSLAYFSVALSAGISCLLFFIIILQFLPELALVCLTVAWLHDVADHKYISQDPTLRPALNTF
jgi:hypothetical protein